MQVRSPARVLDRAEQLKDLAGPVALAEPGEGRDHPGRGVRVLPAVLANARPEL
jgi:hypothetical protein